MVRGFAIKLNVGNRALGLRGLRVSLDSIWIHVGSDSFDWALNTSEAPWRVQYDLLNQSTAFTIAGSQSPQARTTKVSSL